MCTVSQNLACFHIFDEYQLIPTLAILRDENLSAENSGIQDGPNASGATIIALQISENVDDEIKIISETSSHSILLYCAYFFLS